MSEPLDFPKLESVCWRALCLYDVTERDMLMAATIIRLSFVIGEPSLRVNYAIELAHLTGLSKGHSHGVLQSLKRHRVLEISPDGRVYTILPPSKAWPWMYASRVKDEKMAQEVEYGLVWANKGGPRQGDLFAPSAEAEFAEALAIERMRAGLLEYHRAATGPKQFLVTDRPPKFPPDAGELGRPPETGTARDIDGPESLAMAEASASYYWHAENSGSTQGGVAGFPKKEPVPKKGTPQLNALNVSVYSEDVQSTEALNALNGGFPKKEPERMDWRSTLGPEATEQEILNYLCGALGAQAMRDWGGFWRNAIRDCREGVLETINNFKLRVQQRGYPDYPGGWMKNVFMRFRKVIKPAASAANKTSKPTKE